MTDSNKPSILIESLIERMSLTQKLGQMSQVSGNGGVISEALAEQVRSGLVGSIINEVNTDVINELQRIALEETDLGIPLLIGRDVIHGFKTIFPIPLGQAASFSPSLVKQAAHASAIEAAKVGINWTFSPMLDVSRDPRWGRIAESFGEDPFLCSIFGQAMVEGYQGDKLNKDTAIAACAKHFVGYGASESGRDYATTNIPETELRNVYLRPFFAAQQANVATFMTSFGDLNGVPASGNQWLLKQVLRDEWQYKGMVVSDWDSVQQLATHGFTEDDAESARAAIQAGIDMEMSSTTFRYHAPQLVEQNNIDMHLIDNAVRNILVLKEALGLFSKDTSQLFKNTPTESDFVTAEHRALAKRLAIESCVLLENKHQCLPLNKANLSRVAVIGPMADDGYEQLGTWIFDGEERHSVTPLAAINSYLGETVDVCFAKGLNTSRSTDTALFEAAVSATKHADIALVFLGEEAILSGEAHCRANIELPGLQNQLVKLLAETGTPIVGIVMAGRPIIVEDIVEHLDALMFAWHPGTMGGPAIVDLLFGEAIPSGRLPVTVPRHVGQIPLYYSQKHGGKPVSPSTYVHMNDVPVRAAQTSLGMVSAHLDVHYTPRYPFGFGLNYSPVEYSDVSIDKTSINKTESLIASVSVKNIGDYAVNEIVQLYIRDRVGSVTRPIKELKRFKKLYLAPATEQKVNFEIGGSDLMFYDINMQYTLESGAFDVWIGSDSDTCAHQQFTVNKA